jgi:hypothetical protein
MVEIEIPLVGPSSPGAHPKADCQRAIGTVISLYGAGIAFSP